MNENIVNIIVSLAGVLIGGLIAFLSTWGAELIRDKREKKKRKVVLKYEIIGRIHSYLHYDKAQVLFNNITAFNYQRIIIYSRIPNSENVINKSEHYINKNSEEAQKIFYLMMEIEENIARLKLEIMDSYNDLDLESFNDKIDGIIKEANDRNKNTLYNYDDFNSIEKFRTIELEFDKQLLLKEAELVENCEKKKKEILDLFEMVN